MKKILFNALVLSIIASSCGEILDKKVRGNGDIKTETRSTDAFSAIDVSGAIEVFVRQDSSSSVKIESDANLLELIEVHNEGGTLHIHEKDGFNLKSTRGIKVHVTGSTIKNFNASGACNIYSENKLTNTERMDIDLSGASNARLDLNAPAVQANLSGACSITLKGETRNVELDGSGASKFHCYDLMAESVDVSISGAGDADVHASVKLDVSVSGAGSVRYKGNAVVNQRISGAGSVKKAD